MALYPQLRGHYQFENQLLLFPEVHHNTKFSINVYGPQRAVCFDHMANLYAPKTIDVSLAHDGRSPIPGIKEEIEDAEGRVKTTWNTQGHHARLIRVGERQLALFAQLYDEPATPARFLFATIEGRIMGWTPRAAPAPQNTLASPNRSATMLGMSSTPLATRSMPPLRKVTCA